MITKHWFDSIVYAKSKTDKERIDNGIKLAEYQKNDFITFCAHSPGDHEKSLRIDFRIGQLNLVDQFKSIKKSRKTMAAFAHSDFRNQE